MVCDVNGKPTNDLIVTATNQEHGTIESRDQVTIDLDEYEVGRLLRVLPNHACATGAMHNKYYVTDGGQDIVATWLRINGWQ